MATSASGIRTYKLKVDSFAAVRSRTYRVQAIVLTAVVAVCILFALRESGTEEFSWVSLIPVLILVPAIVLAAAYWTSRGLKEREASWLSFELNVGDEVIIRRMHGLPELTIRRDDVIAVRESSEGLVVQTVSKQRFIAIPAALDGFAEVRAHIANWVPPTSAPRYRTPLLYAMAWGLPLAALILIAAVMLVQRSWVVLSTGIPLLAILTWGIVAALRSNLLSGRAKWKFAVLVLPLLAIAYRLIGAVTNWR